MLTSPRWHEAESAATAAVTRDPTSIKALYRRALARRALGKPADALADLNEVLARDPNNAAAAAEMSEVEMEVETARARERSMARAAETAKSQSAEAEAEAAPTAVRPVDVSTPAAAVPSPPAAPPAAPAPTGFAALRKSRDARPAYAGTTDTRMSPPVSSPPSAPSPAVAPTTAPPPPPEAAPTPTAPMPAASTPVAPSAPPRQPSPPPDPASTAPGAGLALLRTLKGTPPQYRRWYLRHYAPGTIARIVAPVLEPDGLGLLLASVGPVGQRGEGDGMGGEEEEKAWTREVIERLKGLPRWRMTVGMLSKGERAAGEAAWAWAGGEGGLV